MHPFNLQTRRYELLNEMVTLPRPYKEIVKEFNEVDKQLKLLNVLHSILMMNKYNIRFNCIPNYHGLQRKTTKANAGIG